MTRNFKEAFYLQKPEVHFPCHHLHKKSPKQNTKPNKPHPFFHMIILYLGHFVKPGKNAKRKKNNLDIQGNTYAKISNS